MNPNTYKKNNTSVSTRKSSFFTLLENYLSVEKFFNPGLPLQFLFPILFITLLGILYIGNLHYAEKNIRKINKLEIIVQDLRADYTTLKADYMYATKQSEVVKKAVEIGLVESKIPPFKIIIQADEY